MNRRRGLIGAKKSRLPSEYQEVEYLRNLDKSYIDTGLSTQYPVKSVIDFRPYAHNVRMSGFYRESPAFSCYWSLSNASFTNYAYPVHNGSSYSWVQTRYPLELSVRHTLTVDYLSFVYIIDDEIGHCGNYFFPLAQGTYKLFAFLTLNAALEGQKDAECFSAKFEDTTGLVRDYIPCRRKSDGKPGMYDLCGSICPLTGTPFYINAGTGEFIAGNPV